ncbi:CaiB/BaiF CoA transferase family protein [Amycolatopsis taiwanensis]|uniref:CaiB/BaiF CoA transferase family protein n=1 Tax=Amycolatopsis taiwanensis TaxID=342230 RepID=UPI000486B705|nr:CoA transferase [Amycolatopsis taiwanensis]
MAPPLDNLRVLDFSRILAGPFATMQLADLGATVTKIERPGRGDDTRSWGPPHDERGQATYFQSVNRNKNSLVLDLTDEHDRARARQLATEADVVVENFRPGLMAEFGLDYDQLRPGNPGLVYCSITGFGRGAGAAMPGYDLLIQALGGLMSITGDPGGEPQKVGVAVVDVLTGLFATTGILGALYHRRATGRGQRIDVDLFSCLLAGLVNQASAFTSAGVVAKRMGNRHPSIAPYELLPCADGNLVLAVGNDRQFTALCKVLGAPELAADDRFGTNPDRVANRQALHAELVRLLAARPAAEWTKELTEARVPAGVVNDIAGAFALAQDLGLDPIVEVPRPDGTTVAVPRNPVNYSETPPAYYSAPPDLPERER